MVWLFNAVCSQSLSWYLYAVVPFSWSRYGGTVRQLPASNLVSWKRGSVPSLDWCVAAYCLTSSKVIFGVCSCELHHLPEYRSLRCIQVDYFRTGTWPYKSLSPAYFVRLASSKAVMEEIFLIKSNINCRLVSAVFRQHLVVPTTPYIGSILNGPKIWVQR